METKQVHVKNRKSFRNWLTRNHNKEKRVELIVDKKHTGTSPPSHRELMEEAICFGWIDTTIKRFDENQFIRTFVKRNKNGKWSENTQGYAKELIKKGLMTRAGLKAFEEGQLYKVIKWPKTSKDLNEVLDKKQNKKAKEFFKNLAPTYKKAYIRQIESAKRKETKKKRIKDTVKRLKEGRKPFE